MTFVLSKKKELNDVPIILFSKKTQYWSAKNDIYLFAFTISILFAKSRKNCKNPIFTSIFYTAKSSSATFKSILIELLEECYLQQCCLKSCDNKKGKCIKKTTQKTKTALLKRRSLHVQSERQNIVSSKKDMNDLIPCYKMHNAYFRMMDLRQRDICRFFYKNSMYILSTQLFSTTFSRTIHAAYVRKWESISWFDDEIKGDCLQLVWPIEVFRFFI